MFGVLFWLGTGSLGQCISGAAMAVEPYHNTPRAMGQNQQPRTWARFFLAGKGRQCVVDPCLGRGGGGGGGKREI